MSELDFDVDEFERDQIPIIKEGYLRKKKQRGFRLGLMWQTRYFIIDNKSQVLRYGNHENSAGKRSISFSEIKGVELERRGGTEFTISMKGSASGYNANRVFVLRADEPSESEEWVAALQRVSIDGKAAAQKKEERAAAVARVVHGGRGASPITNNGGFVKLDDQREASARADQPARAKMEVGKDASIETRPRKGLEKDEGIRSGGLCAGCWPF